MQNQHLGLGFCWTGFVAKRVLLGFAPYRGSKSTLTKPLEIPGKKVLIVENTMRPLGSGVSAFKTNGTVNALFCEHAGPGS